MTQDGTGAAGPDGAPPASDRPGYDICISAGDQYYANLAHGLQKAARQADFLELTGLNGPDLEIARTKARLTTLRKLADEATSMGRIIAIFAVRDGHLSRVQAADILGVHQATVARWVKEYGLEEADQASEDGSVEEPAPSLPAVSEEHLSSTAAELPRQTGKAVSPDHSIPDSSRKTY